MDKKGNISNISLEVMAEAESLFSVSTCDPTQRLRVNPVALNLHIYKDQVIYIIFDRKNSLYF